MAVAVLGLYVADKFLHVVHIVVQVELALTHWHQAGVLPIGDVDLVVAQHGLDRVAQKCGVVAGKRGDDEYSRLVLCALQHFWVIAESFEAAQLAKRFVQLNAFVNCNVHTFDFDGA